MFVYVRHRAGCPVSSVYCRLHWTHSTQDLTHSKHPRPHQLPMIALLQATVLHAHTHTEATFTLIRVRVRVPESEFRFTARTSLTHVTGVFMVTCTRTTQRLSTNSLLLNRIERMLSGKVTIFHYIDSNFTNRTPPINEQLTLT